MVSPTATSPIAISFPNNPTRPKTPPIHPLLAQKVDNVPKMLSPPTSPRPIGLTNAVEAKTTGNDVDTGNGVDRKVRQASLLERRGSEDPEALEAAKALLAEALTNKDPSQKEAREEAEVRYERVSRKSSIYRVRSLSQTSLPVSPNANSSSCVDEEGWGFSE